MQVPKRKPGKFTHVEKDFYITQEKYDELQKEKETLLKNRPAAIEDMQKQAENGDFSENAAYQVAKGRLRRINYRLDEINHFLKYVHIIKKSENGKIQIGSTVILDLNGKEFTFQILGSSETNPSKGVISHRSQLGEALLGQKKGDKILLTVNDRTIEYTVISVE